MRAWEVGLVVALCGFAAPLKACDVYSANETISRIQTEIRNGTIDRVEVLGIPEDLNTFIPISPEMLEESLAPPAEKYSIKVSKENASRFLASIVALTPRQEQSLADLRWGFWFLDGSGKRLHSIFFDSERWYARGRRGYIDGIKCNFSSSLIHWVSRRGKHATWAAGIDVATRAAPPHAPMKALDIAGRRIRA
jgi:hypothetical protein